MITIRPFLLRVAHKVHDSSLRHAGRTNQGSYKVLLLVVGGLVRFAVRRKVLPGRGLAGGAVSALVVAQISVEEEAHHHQREQEQRDHHWGQRRAGNSVRVKGPLRCSKLLVS